MDPIPPNEDAAAARDALDETAEKLGLYMDRAWFLDTPAGTVIVADFMIGDLAWSQRVQNPDLDEADTAFEQMIADTAREGFDDLAEQIRKNIAEGRSPFDEGEGER